MKAGKKVRPATGGSTSEGCQCLRTRRRADPKPASSGATHQASSGWLDPWRRWELSTRRALLDAMLPRPSAVLPAMADADLGAFWRQVDRRAPVHLRLALPAASVLLGLVLPLGMGFRRTFAQLDEAAREAVLERAARLPLGADLVDVVKIVACLAYFDDPAVQRLVRGDGAGAPTPLDREEAP